MCVYLYGIWYIMMFILTILIIPGLHICKFSYRLKFICNLKNYWWHFFSYSFVDIGREPKMLSCLIHTCPDEIQHGNGQCSTFLVSSPTANKNPFCGPFKDKFFTCMCFGFYLFFSFPIYLFI